MFLPRFFRFAGFFVLLAGWIYGQSSPAEPPEVANRAVSAISPNSVTSNSVNANTAAKTLPEIPPLPEGKTTLLGGTIATVDHIRDRLILQVFGAGQTAVLFDERTRVFRDGKTVSTDELKTGERAYVDTTLDGTKIFARNIRLATAIPAAESSGQVVAFDSGSGELTLRDSLSPEPVKMRLIPNATILRGDQRATRADLRPGALVSLIFAPGGELPWVRQLSIIAAPGTDFVFWGQVEHLDLHRGLLVVLDPRDNRSYEVSFDSSLRSLTQDLRHGASVTVNAVFDGKGYQARSITVNPASPK